MRIMDYIHVMLMIQSDRDLSTKGIVVGIAKSKAGLVLQVQQ